MPPLEDLLAENRRLRRENRELRRENHGLHTELTWLRQENQALKARFGELEAQLAKLRDELARLREENEALKGRLGNKGNPPLFKPARNRGGGKPGRKLGHPGERRPLPSRVDEEKVLTLERCPDCGSRLRGPAAERVRYVEDLLSPRVHVTRYRIHRYWCPRKGKLVERKPTDVLPGHQLGIQAMSYVVYLREELRLPVKGVQAHLAKAGLHVTQGEIEHGSEGG
jgi:transposase